MVTIQFCMNCIHDPKMKDAILERAQTDLEKHRKEFESPNIKVTSPNQNVPLGGHLRLVYFPLDPNPYSQVRDYLCQAYMEAENPLDKESSGEVYIGHTTVTIEDTL